MPCARKSKPIPKLPGKYFPVDFHLRFRPLRSIGSAVKTIILISGLSVLAIVSSACNTTIGLGRDMRILGESMESQAQKTYQGNDAGSGAPVY